MAIARLPGAELVEVALAEELLRQGLVRKPTCNLPLMLGSLSLAVARR